MMTKEIELGFGKSPKRRTVHINRQYDDCLWYFWDGGNNCHIPIPETDLFCYVQSLEIREGEYKGSPTYKLNINVQADVSYRLVAGLDTAFAKSITSALLMVEDFTKPVAITVRAGSEDGVVFGGAWQGGETKELPQLKTGDDVRDAMSIINAAIANGTSIASVQPASQDNLSRLTALRQMTGCDKDEAKAIASSLKLDPTMSSSWDEATVIRYRNSMFARWGYHQGCFKAFQHATNALYTLVVDGIDDSELWHLWCADVERRKSEAQNP